MLERWEEKKKNTNSPSGVETKSGPNFEEGSLRTEEEGAGDGDDNDDEDEGADGVGATVANEKEDDADGAVRLFFFLWMGICEGAIGISSLSLPVSCGGGSEWDDLYKIIIKKKINKIAYLVFRKSIPITCSTMRNMKAWSELTFPDGVVRDNHWREKIE